MGLGASAAWENKNILPSFRDKALILRVWIFVELERAEGKKRVYKQA